MDGGWNRFFGGLETFLDLFVIFRANVDVPPHETSFVHNALTRRIDPRHPEGPWLHFLCGSRFWHFAFFRFWAQGPGPGPPFGGGGRPWSLSEVICGFFFLMTLLSCIVFGV